MRRIPRPSRAIDASASIPLSIRHRVSPAVVPCTHLRTPAAAFSTTPSAAFLLPGKQDKKKHQQFVRRWQKRLLGDSEPIGAHVDPYDPTSPVRIAPEEQGDYEEVLDEEGKIGTRGGEHGYLPAEELGAELPGRLLMHVGGERWLQQKLEGDMAKEFEKLTRQTYTPLTLDMANDIETLTGSPYTLRDDNLEMAQTVHEVTGRPYTKYDFGLHPKVRVKEPEDIRNRFIQAVAEVYALREAGSDMDLAKLPNRGVYDSPGWVRKIKLHRTESGELALAYPKYKSAEAFIKVMQSTPEGESAQTLEGEEEVLLDEAEDLLDPVLPQEPAPIMDPATPAFKREAVVKIDPTKKPFDFMSNRPVPRAKPVETAPVEEVVEVEEPAVEVISPAPSRLAELMSTFEKSQSAVNGLRHTVLEHRAQKLADDLAALRKAAWSIKPSSSSPAAHVEEVKWRHVPITDNNVKFALFKRLFQLTGLHISDPHLTSSDTLGDLYGHLCAAAKPRPTSVYSAMYQEGQKARERVNQLEATGQIAPRRKADLGDLLTLGNVELRRVKPTKPEKRKKTGIHKVIGYALEERRLLDRQHRQGIEPVPEHLLGLKVGVDYGVREGTRDVPEYGRPVTSKGVNTLVKATRRSLAELEEVKEQEVKKKKFFGLLG